MGFLDKLWDETLAGPAPDSGLGKLRKYNSFSARSAAAPPQGVAARPQDDSHAIPVSRSITVLPSGASRNLSVSVNSPSVPSSQSGSSAPSSPSSRKVLSFCCVMCGGFVHGDCWGCVRKVLLSWGDFHDFGLFGCLIASTPGRNFKKLTRRKSAPGASQNSDFMGPSGYDWIMLSALDR